MKTFLIIGMGSFGHHLCRALAEQKCEVMIVAPGGQRTGGRLHQSGCAALVQH